MTNLFSSSRCKIFVAGDTKGKESAARLRVRRQQRILCPLKGGCVSPRDDTAKKPSPFSLTERNRVAERVQERGERTCRARRQTIRCQMTGSRTRIACSVTPTDRRKVASGKSGVLRSSCLRIDPIGISFKPPTAPFSPRHVEIKTSGSADVELSDDSRTTPTSDERSSVRRPLKCTREPRRVAICRTSFRKEREKKGIEGDNLILAKEKIRSNCSISAPASFGSLIRWHPVSDRG